VCEWHPFFQTVWRALPAATMPASTAATPTASAAVKGWHGDTAAFAAAACHDDCACVAPWLNHFPAAAAVCVCTGVAVTSCDGHSGRSANRQANQPNGWQINAACQLRMHGLQHILAVNSTTIMQPPS
jgi:hypothetical protein